MNRSYRDLETFYESRRRTEPINERTGWNIYALGRWLPERSVERDR